MRTIMIMNAKGGCGKSTLATNIAGYYAVNGKNVLLADFDVQQSSMEWLDARDENRPLITGLDASTQPVKPGKKTDIVIYDVPSVTHGKDLTKYTQKVDTLIIPVLPSPLDIRAASRFVKELFAVNKVSRKEIKLALVANRVRENTIVYHKLTVFLKSLKIPFIATLRDTQNYIRAADRGLSVFELPPSATTHDIEQWQPLIKWLNSKRSMP